MKTTTKIAIIVAAIAGGVAAVIVVSNLARGYVQRATAEAALHDYATALVARDYKHAYELCTDEFRGATSLEEFSSQQQQEEAALGQLREVREGDFYVHGRGDPMVWTATFEAVFVHDRGSHRFFLSWHYQDGRWRLFGYKPAESRMTVSRL